MHASPGVYARKTARSAQRQGGVAGSALACRRQMRLRNACAIEKLARKLKNTVTDWPAERVSIVWISVGTCTRHHVSMSNSAFQCLSNLAGPTHAPLYTAQCTRFQLCPCQTGTWRISVVWAAWVSDEAGAPASPEARESKQSRL